MAKCISLMREVFLALHEGKAINQPRRRLVVPGGAVLHQMAGAWGDYFGTKIYSTHPKHGAWFLFQLYDSATGRPLALIEANRLGQIRTGAASGLATDVMARPDASSLAVIGSGFQAESQVEAVMAVRPIQKLRVWSRSAEKRSAFARRFEASCDARAVETAEQAVAGADIIVTATFARDPVIDVAWVSAGAHVNAIGSNNARRRELPPELLERATVIAADSVEQARIEAGDLLLGLPEGEWNRVVELHELVAQPQKHAGLTVFKSLGLGVEDVRAAAFVYEEARRTGAGAELPLYS